MKRFELNSKKGASLIHFPKLVLMFAVLLALDLSIVSTVDAQRHGGGHFGGRSIGNYQMFRAPMNFRYHGHFNHGFYGIRSVPYWNYYYLPRWGDYYWDLPPYDWAFLYNGINFYYNDGIYFKDNDGKYEVVPAPVGYITKSLPKDSYSFSMDGNQYFYYYGSFYVPKDGKFEVVKAPVGAVVESIPQGYDKVVIDGQTYYTLDKVQYKVIVKNNEVWYQVIKNG